MRLKDLFTVPAGQKVTERHLRRVLVSSICSILLCMSCLVGTTWAWFTVSLENTDNVIQIGPDVAVTVDGAAFVSGETLAVGTHTVSLTQKYVADDFQSTRSACVTFAFDAVDTVYYVMLPKNGDAVTVTINAERACTLSWQVLWAVPEGAVPVSGTITVPAVNTTNLDGESAGDPGEEAADAGDESAEGTPDTGTEPGEDTSTEPGDNMTTGSEESGENTTGEDSGAADETGETTPDDPAGEQSETDETPDDAGDTTAE